MRNSKILKFVLFLCGGILLFAGAKAMFTPVGFTARNGIDIIGNTSLINDYRSTGGLMIGGAILILLGIFKNSLAYTSALVASIIFTTFTLARVLSITLDGMPAETLIKATIVEGILALFATVAFIKYRETKQA